MTTQNPGPASFGFANQTAFLGTPPSAQVTAQSAAANYLLSSQNLSMLVSPASVALLQGSSYARTRAKKAAIAAGTLGTRLRIAWMGSSLSVGEFALGAGNTTQAGIQPHSPPSLCASFLNSAGLPANDFSWFADQNCTNGNYATYDVRIAGSGPGSLSGSTLGGLIGSSTTSSQTVTFQPQGLTDSCKFWYPSVSGNGAFTLTRAIDSLTSGTVTPGATTAYASVSVGPGVRDNSSPWTVTTLSATNTTFGGMECWDSTIPGVTMMNVAAGFYASGNWNITTNAYSYLPALETLAPDLLIMECGGVNDWLNNIALSTYQTNINAIVAAMLPTTDIIFETQNPTLQSTHPLNSGSYPQTQYQNAFLAIAATNNIAVQDVFTKHGSGELQTALGGGAASTTLIALPYARYSNGAHTTRNIYLERAQAMANMILAI